MRCYLNEHFVCIFLIELVMLKSVPVFSYLSCQLSSENVCCITTYRKNAKLQKNRLIFHRKFLMWTCPLLGGPSSK